MPDLLAIRYLHANGVSIVAWIETKRQRGGQLGVDQIKWRDIEQKLGAVVLLSNDFDAFLAEYEARFSWLHKPPYSVPGHQGRLELT